MAETTTWPCGLPQELVSDDECQTRIVRMLAANRTALLSFLRRMRFKPEDAEDVLQETCVRILSKRCSWRGERSAQGFIYAIAANLARDELRRRRRCRQPEHVSFEEVDVVCSRPHPSQQVETACTTDKILRALRALTPRCQEMVDMHFAQEMSLQCIASQLGVSKKTVEREITMARHYCGAVLRRAS